MAQIKRKVEKVGKKMPLKWIGIEYIEEKWIGIGYIEEKREGGGRRIRR